MSNEQCHKYRRNTRDVKPGTMRVAVRVKTGHWQMAGVGCPMRNCDHGLNIGPLYVTRLGHLGEVNPTNSRLHLGDGLARKNEVTTLRTSQGWAWTLGVCLMADLWRTVALNRREFSCSNIKNGL